MVDRAVRAPHAPWRLVVLLAALCFLLGACRSPVGVKRLSPARAQSLLTKNVISTGKLSGTTKNLLRLSGLEELWRVDPAAAILRIHEPVMTGASEGIALACSGLVSAAELSFSHAMRSGDAAWFLTSAIYAWAALFPAERGCQISRFDRRLRLAADLYNRGVTLAFVSSAGEISARNRVLALPIGTLSIDVDQDDLTFGSRPLASFTSVTDLEVRGLRNRYRRAGIGAPLAAGIGPAPAGSEDVDASYLPNNIKVAVSAVLLFEDFWDGALRGEYRARLEIAPAAVADSILFEGRDLPLEMEPTAALAFSLTEANPWARELKGFFQGDLSDSGDGLSTLAPYRGGRIPVVLVHGTASSAARWADLINDLSADPELRRSFQFWFFQYNTGNPILYSSWLLRKAIGEMLDTLDPGRRDPAMSRIVVVGHSQGGLLAKLTAVDAGDAFWSMASEVPPEQAELSPESRRIMEGALLVRPVPEVKRVIYLSTPHRGSYLATLGPARWLSRMTKTPANLFNAASDLVTQDEEGRTVRRLDRLSSAVDDMTPGSTFLEMLLGLSVEPPAVANSIISVRGMRPLDRANDGVVAYSSAHVDGVESELIVDSAHSSQSDPAVISEVRRILFEHLGTAERPGHREIFQGPRHEPPATSEP